MMLAQRAYRDKLQEPPQGCDEKQKEAWRKAVEFYSNCIAIPITFGNATPHESDREHHSSIVGLRVLFRFCNRPLLE